MKQEKIKIFEDELMEVQVLAETLINQMEEINSSIRLKILFLLHLYKNATPSLLLSKTGLLKTNLTVCCRNLKNEGLILSKKNPYDNRGVVYYITELGENEVIKIQDNLRKIIRPNEVTSDVIKAFEIVARFLNKKV